MCMEFLVSCLKRSQTTAPSESALDEGNGCHISSDFDVLADSHLSHSTH